MNKIFIVLCLTIIGVKVNAKDIWVYFDIGNTVINTHQKNNFHYYEGVKEYLQTLKKIGLRVGAISNIPESFGHDYDEKIKTLKSYISKRWKSSEKLDWSLFEKIYIPLSNAEMKPAPTLYLRALAENGNCPSLFVSETEKEVEQALKHGFAGHVFDEAQNELYIPLKNIKKYILENTTSRCD